MRRKSVPLFHCIARTVSCSRLTNSSRLTSFSFAISFNSPAVGGTVGTVYCAQLQGVNRKAKETKISLANFFMRGTSISESARPSPETCGCTSLFGPFASISRARLLLRGLPPSTKQWRNVAALHLECFLGEHAWTTGRGHSQSARVIFLT